MSAGDGLTRLHTALTEHGSTIRGTAARCPAHEDTQASLSIGQGNAGAFLKCHAGCATDDVLAALSLTYADLFDEPRKRGNGRAYEVTATYAYTGELGEPLFYCERRIPKDFRQYHFSDGRKVWNLSGVRRVLYRLPRVLAAAACGDVVYVAEGEKDVHSLEAAGAVATCNPMGAGKWRPEYGDMLKGAAVIIVADRDDAGRKHAAAVRADLVSKGIPATIVEGASGKDATDHLDAGHGLADFRAAALCTQSGAQLLDDVASFLRGYVAFPSGHAAVAVTLWAVHTHLAAAFESTPRLALLSPEKQCGKTRVLELLELLCSGAEMLSDASPAYLYRRIGAGSVTILLDEADAIWKRGKADESAEALRSIVNAGHRRSATVGRVEMNGQAAKLVKFPVYAPAAIAGIGNLPDTIMDRAVVIHMRRRSPDQAVRPYRERITRPEGDELRELLTAWCAQIADKVGDPWPELPPGVTDRKSDVWEPLVAIADLAGGDWPRLAREACTAMVTGAADDTETIGTRLLADIRAVWPGSGTSGTSGTALASSVPDVPAVPHMATDDLLNRLHGIEEGPWADWYGHPLNPRDLAKLLKPYGVRSLKIRIGETTPRGYRAADFADSWRSYLGSAPRQLCTVCGLPLDQVLIDAGYTDHGETEASQ